MFKKTIMSYVNNELSKYHNSLGLSKCNAHMIGRRPRRSLGDDRQDFLNVYFEGLSIFTKNIVIKEL